MTLAVAPQGRTFLDALVAALERASAYNKQDQDRPAAVLWTDKERQWEPLIPQLRAQLPVFTRGPYAPDVQSGPAYWLRCVIARTIAHPGLEQDRVPVLYLPGYGPQHIRAMETCPPELQPLAELQYRGVLWRQRNGRDWTIAAFLQSEEMGIEVAADAATREALLRGLVKLADQSIVELRREAPIRAPFLHGLIHPDDEKAVLQWLNNPQAFRAGLSEDEWASFVALCQNRYGFHPEKDGTITAGRLLGQRAGAWNTVWKRFAEAPATYIALPETLRQARPTQQLSLLDHGESWPQDNDVAESGLRKALADVGSTDASAARRLILDLERDHGMRREWVWSRLGKSPLASSLAHLATLARESAQQISGSSVSDVVTSYADSGWRADLAVLDALASVESSEDLGAVRRVVQTIYRPWLEACAVALQKAVGSDGQGALYLPMQPPSMEDGTCVLFADGLRFDVAQRLRDMLQEHGIECTTANGLAALPTVTGTAKPSVSPAAAAFAGGTTNGIDPVLAATGTKVNLEVLRRALATAGIQVLRGDDLGDPSGQAWTELGAIDAYGHEHGWRLAHHVGGELRAIERRIAQLLDHGWKVVIVVTDHGWLLLPGGLPKAELPEHLTEVRKGRCARLKDGAQTDQQVVPWRWDPSVRIAVAPGIHCYEAGKEYEHGGISPQECVVPILTVYRPASTEGFLAIESVTWRGLRCEVTAPAAQPPLRADLRTRSGDSTTSLARGGKEFSDDGAVSLLVEDDDMEGGAAVVVILSPDGTVRAQVGTVVGG